MSVPLREFIRFHLKHLWCTPVEIQDVQNPEGEMSGGKRLRGVLEKPAQTPAQIFAVTLAALDEHIGTGMQFDNMTLLVASRI